MQLAYREIRLQCGLTLEVVASQFGRTKQWLSLVERGDVKISFDDAIKLATIYGVTPDIFLPSASSKTGQNCEKGA